MKNSIKALLVLAAASCAVQAYAISFDFYKLSPNGTGANDFLPEPGYLWEGGDAVSSDIKSGNFSGSLVYKQGDLVATLTAFYKDGNNVYQEAAVVADNTGSWTFAKSAGVGVYDPENGHSINSINRSDDNITLGEMLVVTFNRVVTLGNLGLRAEGHNFTKWNADATFLLNGDSYLLPQGSGVLDEGPWTGKQFAFEFGGENPDQYYVSSMEVSVPDTGSTLALLGVGILSLAAIRKRFSSAC